MECLDWGMTDEAEMEYLLTNDFRSSFSPDTNAGGNGDGDDGDGDDFHGSKPVTSQLHRFLCSAIGLNKAFQISSFNFQIWNSKVNWNGIKWNANFSKMNVNERSFMVFYHYYWLCLCVLPFWFWAMIINGGRRCGLVWLGSAGTVSSWGMWECWAFLGHRILCASCLFTFRPQLIYLIFIFMRKCYSI